MITLFPDGAAPASGWIGQNAWLMVWAAAVIAACVWKALLHGTSADGWSDTGAADSCQDSPDCGTD